MVAIHTFPRTDSLSQPWCWHCDVMTKRPKPHATFIMQILRVNKIKVPSMPLCGFLLFCFQISHMVSSGDTSNIYMAEVLIEGNSSLDVANFLSGLDQLIIDSATIVEATMTGQCEIIGKDTTCWCEEGYIWSDTVCDKVSTCCNNYLCMADISDSIPLCVPQTNVSIIGTITMTTATDYEPALLSSFKLLNGFDSITTTTPQSGIQDFIVTLNATFKTEKLQKLITTLQANYSNIITVNATSQGLVIIEVPPQKVCYNSQYTLNCSMEEKMDTCMWQVTRPGQDPQIIGAGSEVILSASCTDRTTISLTNITWFWAGIYTCMLTQGSVSHMASAELKVALLPEIVNVTSTPTNLDCTAALDVSFNVKCSIKTSVENYTVTLNDVTPQQSVYNNIIVYNKTFTIHCNKKSVPSPEIIGCKITNSVDQTRTVNLSIPIIYPGDEFCEVDGIWPKSKNGTTATILCTELGRLGTIIRTCNGGVWGDPVSFCVKQEINVLTSTAGDFEKGVGATQDQAHSIFDNLRNTTGNGNITYGDVSSTVSVFDTMSRASVRFTLNESLLPNFIDSASNMLNNSWVSGDDTRDGALASSYLSSVETLVHNIKLNTNDGYNTSNIQLQVCRQSSVCNRTVFNVDLELNSSASVVKTVGLQSLADRLPKGDFKDSIFPSLVVSVTTENRTSPVNIRMGFSVGDSSNADLYCVFWNTTEQQWSEEGCNLTQGSGDFRYCECDHLTSFSMLMSRTPVSLPLLDEITYVGLGISICSLVVFIIIEFLVWNAVVKSNLSHFRHTSLLNISFCLLIADCSFVASSVESILTDTLCLVLVLVKHFFYLAMFFWMLCLSVMLLHQLIFVFSTLRKKVYMILSYTIGYVCPVLTVGSTYIYYNKRTDVSYYSRSTCWLTYAGTLKGSLFAFLLPVGIIVFINIFCMAMVMATLLKPGAAESNKKDNKEAARSIIKVIVFLTPVFGGTWILGLFVFLLDPKSFSSVLMQYAFTIVNSLQGFLILLTGCFAEKRVRDEIVKLVLSNNKNSKREGKTKLTSVAKQ
ncbi:adhesion G-protein coupled receptor F3 [Brachyhypopomus gauderio]|uniref:adhesion G-protein coupled receptor F3 n=1 Tax=Brachyhypopomus gauderio TaxID=698409 RepID=UPI00404277ED